LEAIRASRSGAVTAGRFRTRRGALSDADAFSACCRSCGSLKRVSSCSPDSGWFCRSSSASFSSTGPCGRCIWLRSHIRSVRLCYWLRPGVCTGLLFGRHRLKSLVSASHNYAIAGLLLLGVALAGVVLIIFDTVPDRSRRGSRTSAHCWRWPASGSSCRCGSVGVRTPLSRVC